MANYNYIVQTADGARRELSTDEQLLVGEVVFNEVVERIEPHTAAAALVTCRAPKALIELMLEWRRPSPETDKLVVVEGDPEREYKVGDVIPYHHRDWRVRHVGASEAPYVARLICEQLT